MIKFCTLYSSSSGNCAFISDTETNILIDAGVSASRITSALQEIDVEGRNEYDTFRIDRDLRDLDQNGEGVDQMPQDDSLGDLLPLSGEGVGICEEIRNITGVHDPG